MGFGDHGTGPGYQEEGPQGWIKAGLEGRLEESTVGKAERSMP
jgi:hypothetical protein